MPLLKYSIYENLLKNELTKKEINELLEFVYVVSLAHLKFNQLNESKLRQEELEEKVINKITELFTKKRKQFILTKSLKKNKAEIKNEIDFNYWIVKIISQNK